MGMQKYMKPRDVAKENTGVFQRIRAGKLWPVAVQAFGPSEGGVVSNEINLELDPIIGRMLTNITAEFHVVYVPDRAIDALKNPEHDLPGNDEALRERILNGEDVFAMEPPTEITNEVRAVPISVDGVPLTNERTRLAYIAANNYLRRRLYHKATQLDKDVTTIQPALLGSTVLQRFNAVLNPEDRVNGAVNFEGRIPISGFGIDPSEEPDMTGPLRSSAGDEPDTQLFKTTAGSNSESQLRLRAIFENGKWRPNAYADLSKVDNEISLLDFANARRNDQLTREMAALVEEYPEYGEQIVARFAAGLKMDMGKQPALLHYRKLEFSNNYVRGMDGPSLDKIQTQNFISYPITVPIPKNEFGGVVVTMVSIKPDETIADQPHPRLSAEYKRIDYLRDEMKIHEPQRVTVREVKTDCAQADEGTLVFYNGNNHLKKNYVDYGFSLNLTDTQIDQLSDRHVLWQHEIPLSVTPDNIVYPSDIQATPFAITDGPICSAQIVKRAVIGTPLIMGDVPVEEMDAIDDPNIFGEGYTTPIIY